MPSPVQAQVAPSFAPDAGGDLQLVIEHDPNGAPDLNVHLLLFPAVDAQLVVDVGSARYGKIKTVPVPGGVVEFNGSSLAQLPKVPSGETPQIRVLRASDANGTSQSIGISYDAGTGELRASAECVGAVAYSAYKAQAREIIYTPLTENLGGGSRTTYGTIVAFYPPRSQVVFPVQPFDLDQGNVTIELYRIVSNTVVTVDGEFERPPDYPASGTYPDAALELDTSTSMETQRIHEIGYMDMRRKFGWVDVFDQPILEPYVGNASYMPTKRLIESTLPAERFSPEEIAAAKNFIASRGFGKA